MRDSFTRRWPRRKLRAGKARRRAACLAMAVALPVSQISRSLQVYTTARARVSCVSTM